MVPIKITTRVVWIYPGEHTGDDIYLDNHGGWWTKTCKTKKTIGTGERIARLRWDVIEE